MPFQTSVCRLPDSLLLSLVIRVRPAPPNLSILEATFDVAEPLPLDDDDKDDGDGAAVVVLDE